MFEVLLDGRTLKTPGRKPLMLPNKALAMAVAAEWCVKYIRPSRTGGSRSSATNFKQLRPPFGPPSRHWKSSHRLGGPSQICLLGQWEVRELRVGLKHFGGRQDSGLQCGVA